MEHFCCVISNKTGPSSDECSNAVMKHNETVGHRRKNGKTIIGLTVVNRKQRFLRMVLLLEGKADSRSSSQRMLPCMLEKNRFTSWCPTRALPGFQTLKTTCPIGLKGGGGSAELTPFTDGKMSGLTYVMKRKPKQSTDSIQKKLSSMLLAK